MAAITVILLPGFQKQAISQLWVATGIYADDPANSIMPGSLASISSCLAAKNTVSLCHLQIYADGHCAALRLKDLLSSDSTVLAVGSPDEMWFSRLLVPWQHVIPVV